ncbi:MAG: NMD3-related protein [Nanopusillaceae archaeon]
MIYKRFCANCGRETEKLIENLCESCYNKIKNGKKLVRKVKICKYCGKYFYKNKIIKKEELKNLEIEKEYFICESCKKIYSKKYNTIIQLRKFLENEITIFLEFLNKENIIIKKYNQINNDSLDLYVFLERNILKKFIKFLKRNKFNVKITKKLKTYDAQHGKKIYILTLRIQK